MMAAGIRQRHGRGCKRTSGCRCPYEASVYSKRDGKKIRKTFPTLATAKAWRNDASTAVRKKTHAGLHVDHDRARPPEAWLEGAREGLIRTRSGDPYKPGATPGL